MHGWVGGWVGNCRREETSQKRNIHPTHVFVRKKRGKEEEEEKGQRLSSSSHVAYSTVLVGREKAKKPNAGEGKKKKEEKL